MHSGEILPPPGEDGDYLSGLPEKGIPYMEFLLSYVKKYIQGALWGFISLYSSSICTYNIFGESSELIRICFII